MLNGKENGFYVEVGADDGENFSNSLFFEGTVLFLSPATRTDSSAFFDLLEVVAICLVML